MNVFSATFLAALGVLASSYLSAQSSPPVYYGPYLQAHAGQFEGDWTRSDGTYRMSISATEEGALKAEYFNPQSINVESTSVVGEADVLILKVVLRDQGYPGSSYELQYMPQYRVLVGSYAIPGQEPSEVYFTK